MKPPSQYWIGPAGWSYDDWNGIVYPQPRPRGFRPLAYLTRFFNAVEVNSSFYAIPSPTTTAAWAEQTPATFRFTVKAPRLLTHERASTLDPRALDAFRECLHPLREAGRLGPVLLQFPWSFRARPENLDYVRRLCESFAEQPRAIEVRHASWSRPEAIEALRSLGSHCAIDQPALRDCLPPTAHVFGPTAYVRLHGRNAKNWFAEGLPGFERYNYLYSDAELREWLARLREMERNAGEIYVFANNHYRGQGVANALELRALLEGRPVDAPDLLVHTYPNLGGRLRSIGERTLFD